MGTGSFVDVCCSCSCAACAAIAVLVCMAVDGGNLVRILVDDYC